MRLRSLLAVALIEQRHLAGVMVAADDIKVDLRPCIITKAAIEQDVSTVSEAYLLSELFKGFWAASQHVIIDTGDGDFDLLNDGDGNHGKCSAIFIGSQPSVGEDGATAQYEQLLAYSAKFQVRLVFFDNAETANLATITTKIGIQQYFSDTLLAAAGIRLKDSDARVVNPALQTDPSEIFFRPVRVSGDPTGGERTIVADLVDSDGQSISDTDGIWDPSSTMETPGASMAAVTFKGEDGSEEMHVFFAMAWFHMESWAWAHYIMEWATQGVFQGERRFWLGAMVDDHFLGTNTFVYNGGSNASDEEERISGEELRDFLSATKALNELYNAEIITEFPFNALGILEKAETKYTFTFEDADAALLAKGEPPVDNGDGTVGLAPTKTPEDWFNTVTMEGLTAEFDSWKEKDDLLQASLDMKDDFFWHSHTLSHQARDNLGQVDCESEDGGNAQIAVITGLFDVDTYGWRSMTTPGITGFYNKNCLKSAMDNLITCAPGDNTYIGAPTTTVSLISDVSQFHSIYTTEEINGLAGFQIVPRFATFVYYNCRTSDCLVLENLFIRRTVCGCTDVDPGTIDNLNIDDIAGCDFSEDSLCPNGLQAFGTADALFDVEAETTTRWILSGRRDKYMFHQANVVPTSTPLGEMSLLEYWYEVVLKKMALYLNLQGDDPFPIKSVKFDDLCTNFKHHEDLDGSNALVTITKTSDGDISGMELSNTGGRAGVIPVTVPTSFADKVSTEGLPDGQPYSKETYGSDLTFYVASSSDDIPPAVVKPTAADLAAVPAPVLATQAPAPAPTSSSTSGSVTCSWYTILWCWWWRWF
ncbi:unnamed protein product [Ectocarpus sp. CCAP 1310/34]|nr:unnamed protein product [Ectocarpus sp. CCAP 1310/34]